MTAIYTQPSFEFAYRAKAKRTATAVEELIVDNFAGGGGASYGIEEGAGRDVDIAINHDPDAIKMHEINHPNSRHFCEDVFSIKPRVVTKGRDVGLAWFSPDCKHFSRAKGAKPVNRKIRGLAWVVIRWAEQAKPRIIMLENVREFQEWGPLVPQWECQACDWRGTEGQTTLARKRRRCPHCDSLRLRESDKKIPDPERKGLTFKRFVGRLRNLGYVVEWHVLNAADFGAPTHRRRLFLIARCDGKPIKWPKPTHGPKAKGKRAKPYRTAAECIDWSLHCPSIYNRKKPLAAKTLRRIAMGILRYVLDNPKPYIVRCNHGGEHFRGQPVDKPMCTLTASRDAHGLVTPYMVEVQNSSGDERHRAVDRPAHTITGLPKGGGMALVSPIIVGTANTKSTGRGKNVDPANEPIKTLTSWSDKALVCPILVGAGGSEYAAKPRPVNAPMSTIKTDDRHQLSAAVLSKYHGQKEDEHHCTSPAEPLRTIDTENRHAILDVAFIAKHYGDTGQRPGIHPQEPLSTITAWDHHAVVATHVMKFRGDSAGTKADAPLPTVTAGGDCKRDAGAAHALGLAAATLVHFNHGEKQWNDPAEPLRAITSNNHAANCYVYLTKFFGTATAADITDPLHTITSKDRFGLTTVETSGGFWLTEEQLATAKQIAVMLRDIVGEKADPHTLWVHDPWNDEVFPLIATIAEGAMCIVVDIGMRMLQPLELMLAQGFPLDYILLGSKATQVRMIGNSVCPVMAKKLVRANFFSAV